MNEMISPAAAVKSEEHWTTKDGGVKLFLFEKYLHDPAKTVGTILFVHGSSMASQPTFDLQVPGRPDSSAMDHFARRGYDCWCVDMEGYGRSTKDRDNNAPIAQGADDCYAAALYIQKLRGKRPFLVYGISSGALRAAMFAERHPDMVARLALDAMVWTGEGSPTLEQRRKKLAEFKATNRRPIDKAFIRSVFDRDHPDTAERHVIDAFADAVTALEMLDHLRTLFYTARLYVDPKPILLPKS
jgi:pimeloyl-ACP methyl ester carboxylesterase